MDVHCGSQEQETGDLLLLVDCYLQFLLLRWYEVIRRLDLNTRSRDWRPFAHGLFFTVPLTFGQIFSRLCTFTATHSVGIKDTRRLNTRIGTGDPYILRTGILLLHKSFDETISSMKTLFPTAIHVTVTTECLSSFKVPIRILLVSIFKPTMTSLVCY